MNLVHNKPTSILEMKNIELDKLLWWCVWTHLLRISTKIDAGPFDQEVRRGEAARQQQRGGAGPAGPHAGAGAATRAQPAAHAPCRVPSQFDELVHCGATGTVVIKCYNFIISNAIYTQIIVRKV